MNIVKKTMCIILTLSIPISQCVAAPCLQSTLSAKMASSTTTRITKKPLPKKRLQDKRYSSILKSAKNFNSNLDEHFLYGLYKGKENTLEHSTLDETSNMRVITFSEEKNVHFDTFKEENDWVQAHPAGRIDTHDFLTKIRNQCAIENCYFVAERTIIENPESLIDDQGHISEGTYIVTLHVPTEHASFIDFLIRIGDVAADQMLGILSEDIQQSANTGIRILGQRLIDVPFGNKERSFITFDKISKRYPAGIALSPDIVRIFTQCHIINNLDTIATYWSREAHDQKLFSAHTRQEIQKKTHQLKQMQELFNHSPEINDIIKKLETLPTAILNTTQANAVAMPQVRDLQNAISAYQKILEEKTSYYMPHIESALGSQGIEIYNKTFSNNFRDPGADNWLAIRSNPRKSMPGILDSRKVHNSDNIERHIGELGAQWYSSKAYTYRDSLDMPHAFTLSLILQQYKPGIKPRHTDTDTLYGSGVFYTRSPNTGEHTLHGRFIENADGDELMTGGEQGEDLAVLKKRAPHVYNAILRAQQGLEEARGFPQQVEFVIRDSVVWYLQTRAIKFSTQAECTYIHDQLSRGAMGTDVAIGRLTNLCSRLDKRTVYKIKPSAQIHVHGYAHYSTPGALQGLAAYSANDAKGFAKANQPFIAIMTKENREEILDCIFTLHNAGIITTYGNDCSHEADLARDANMPALINLKNTTIVDGNIVCEGKTITPGMNIGVDGNTGTLFFNNNSVLMEDRIVTNMTGNIDIRLLREKLNAQYKDASIEELISKNAWLKHEEMCRKAKGESIFLCSIQKHILHLLLKEKSERNNLSMETVNRAITAEYNKLANTLRIDTGTTTLKSA